MSLNRISAFSICLIIIISFLSCMPIPHNCRINLLLKAFLDHLQTKEFRNRRIGLMENGSWAPAAARLMRAELEKMKELRLCETDVSLRGALNQTSEAQMDALVAELCAE